MKLKKSEINRFYVLVIVGDVEAQLVGPFKSRTARDNKAGELVREDAERENGIHWLDVYGENVVPEVGDYSGGQVERWLKD